MHEHVPTTTSFLDSLRHADADPGWAEFDRRYRPIVVGMARHLGLDHQDAADAAQETLLGFVREFRAGGYDRSRGRLRSWLLAMARTRVAALRRTRQRRADACSRLEFVLPGRQAGVRSLTAMGEIERRRELLRAAMEELRRRSRTEPKTLEAFDLLCVHQLSPEVVAAQLGMGVSEVYLAKFRVARRLRTIAAELAAHLAVRGERRAP